MTICANYYGAGTMQELDHVSPTAYDFLQLCVADFPDGTSSAVFLWRNARVNQRAWAQGVCREMHSSAPAGVLVHR